MKKNTLFAVSALALALTSSLAAQVTPSATGPTNGKVAVIEIQAAIFQTKDGQKALADMQAKFNPVKAKLESQRAAIAKDEDTLRKGQNTMSPDALAKLQRDIESETKTLNRETDDANADLEAENQRLMADLGQKMYAIINRYATDKGYVLVIDVSSQNTPVVFASNTIDITREIIAAYDAGAASLPPSTAAAPKRPATPSGIAK